MSTHQTRVDRQPKDFRAKAFHQKAAVHRVYVLDILENKRDPLPFGPLYDRVHRLVNTARQVGPSGRMIVDVDVIPSCKGRMDHHLRCPDSLANIQTGYHPARHNLPDVRVLRIEHQPPEKVRGCPNGR